MGKGSVTPIGSLLKTIKKSLKRGQIFVLIWGQKAIRCSASGGLRRAPDPLTRGSAPGPRWGLRPQTPVIGSRYRACHPAPPLLNSWIRPCNSTKKVLVPLTVLQLADLCQSPMNCFESVVSPECCFCVTAARRYDHITPTVIVYRFCNAFIYISFSRYSVVSFSC